MATTTPRLPLRTLRRPLRLDGRLLAGGVLALLVAGAVLLVLSGPAAPQRALAFRADLPAGRTIAPADLQAVPVRLDPAAAAGVIPADEAGRLVGVPLAVPAFRGELAVRGQFARPDGLGPDERAVTLPIGPSVAATGLLQAGELVEVDWAPAVGTPGQGAQRLLAHARLLAVTIPGGAGSGQPAAVTLAVPADTTLTLAQYSSGGSFFLALVPPAAVATPTTPEAP